ncbi:MAG: hypothetical protein IH594_01895, partial [Bacteroidales bacterium]|nr:hypothetical protein [Bacteroidales bacterium]
MNSRKLIFTLIFPILAHSVWAQPQVIDRVIAIVGDFTILQSDLENQ